MIAGASLGSFAVLLAVMYLAYPYLNPEKSKKVTTVEHTKEDFRFDPAKYGPKAVESLNKQVKNLQLTIDSLKGTEDKYIRQIDSLQNHIEQLKLEQKQAEKTKKITAKKLNNVSKSLLKLGENALAPIVNLLDNEQLVMLYKEASNIQRAKLLRSLKPDKAASILKQVM